MSELIFGIISEGLVLINKLVPTEAIRIQERLNDYKRQWEQEMAKGSLRDDNNLVLLESELRKCSELFLSAIKQANTQGKS